MVYNYDNETIAAILIPRITLKMHGMSFFVACMTSESRTELTLNSSSRMSRTWDTYTDGNALRSGEMS